MSVASTHSGGVKPPRSNKEALKSANTHSQVNLSLISKKYKIRYVFHVLEYNTIPLNLLNNQPITSA